MDTINQMAIIKKINDCFATLRHGKIYRTVMDDTERTLIEQALKRSEGNQLNAARILGVNRNTLRTKIRKFHIDMTRYKQ